MASSLTPREEAAQHEAEQSFAQLLSAVKQDALGRCSGEQVEKLRFNTLLGLLPSNDGRAIVNVHKGKPPAGSYQGITSTTEATSLSHDTLYRHIAQDKSELRKGPFALIRGMKVALAMPTSSELWVTLINVMCYATAVPVNLVNTPQELADEMRGCSMVLVLEGEKNDSAIAGAAIADLAVVTMTRLGKDKPGLVCVGQVKGAGYTPRGDDASAVVHLPTLTKHAQNQPNMRDDVVLVLHTSGSTGKKKQVPYTLSSMVVGALLIAKSRALYQGMTCLSMLPLFHIAGVSRNLAPLLLEGCIIFSGPFNPGFFWEILDCNTVNYYAATPTMHQALLEAGRYSSHLPGHDTIGMIESVGGALAPSLAEELAEWFTAKVMQGYAMTECMPVTCPLVSDPLGKPGSVGVACGPQLAVMTDAGMGCEAGEVGQVMIRGPPLFHGYLNTDNVETLSPDGWFPTGDLGYLDKGGALYITGRSKEVINRGGETLSPFEIEDAMRSHPSLREVMAFSAPHSLFQETVGVAVVLDTGKMRLDLRDVQRHLENKLHHTKWPLVLVYMDSLPKSATNKVLRVNFAKRAAIPETHVYTRPWEALFEAVAPPPGAPLKTPVMCSRVDINLRHVHQLLLSAPGVSGATVMYRELKAGVSLVAFVTPPTVSTDALQKELRLKLHAYQVPEHIIALAELPSMQDEDQVVDTVLKDYGVESYLGVDSLGFQMAKNDDYDMEERVRDNSYVLFLIGIFIDHAYFCFAYLEDIKTCHKLTDVASQWVIDVTMVGGGTKCQLGMLVLAGYLHSARGMHLQAYDGALFAIYMAFRWVYPWFFYWPLGRYARPVVFSLPRWFLLAILEARCILAALGTVRDAMPERRKWIADMLLNCVVGTLLFLGSFWRNYYDSPYFNLCNMDYHYRATCWVGKAFFYERHRLNKHDYEAVWMWPEMCYWLAVYIFWFKHGRYLMSKLRLLVEAVANREKLNPVWIYGVAAVVAFGVVIGLEVGYQNHQLDYAYFMINQESNVPTFVVDEFSYGRMLDLAVYSLEALLLILVMSQMPFHLHRMGSNALGVYICQFALVAVMRNPSVAQTSDPSANYTAYQIRGEFGHGTVVTGLVQLLWIYGMPFFMWWQLGDFAMAYVTFPLRLLPYLERMGVIDVWRGCGGLLHTICVWLARFMHRTAGVGPTPPQSPTPHKGRYGEPNSKLERQPLLGGGGEDEFIRPEAQRSRASRLGNSSKSFGSSSRPSWGTFTFNKNMPTEGGATGVGVKAADKQVSIV